MDSVFDKAYCGMMVDTHKDAIALFEKGSAEVNDTDVKAWAAVIASGIKETSGACYSVSAEM